MTNLDRDFELPATKTYHEVSPIMQVMFLSGSTYLMDSIRLNTSKHANESELPILCDPWHRRNAWSTTVTTIAAIVLALVLVSR